MDCAVLKWRYLPTPGHTFLQNIQIGAKPGLCYNLQDHALALVYLAPAHSTV